MGLGVEVLVQVREAPQRRGDLGAPGRDGSIPDLDQHSLVQTRTLTAMMGQQSRTRAALQGLNYRLSNMGGGCTTKRARELLRRLVAQYHIGSETRSRVHEMVLDAEATLAGHVDDSLLEDECTDEDRNFIDGWWADLNAALNHDVNSREVTAFRCMGARETQEIEHDMEESLMQELAREEWEEHEAARAQQSLATTDDIPAAQYRSWEDWAMFDEMNKPMPTKRRRRTVDMTVESGSQGASSSTSQATASCTLDWEEGEEIRISLRVRPQLARAETGATGASPAGGALKPQEADSDASTLLLPEQAQRNDRPAETGGVADFSATNDAEPEPARAGAGGFGADSEASTLILLGHGLDGIGEGPAEQAVDDTRVPQEVNMGPGAPAQVDAYAEQLRLEFAAQEEEDEAESRARQKTAWEAMLVQNAERIFFETVDQDVQRLT
ncbi:unnamed protein product, partial [Symbiodinium sp. CCMP2456]